ncbi:response regulator transcription factor [Cohnella endophytica]|nr:helix-turn-helix transcriptional regulator [Cohnella endophytica]
MEKWITDLFEKFGLTNRELEVATLIIVKGYSNKELAEILHISEKTVKNHVANFFAKMNIGNIRQLMALCMASLASDASRRSA